jgi:hypothetical protein
MQFQKGGLFCLCSPLLFFARVPILRVFCRFSNSPRPPLQGFTEAAGLWGAWTAPPLTEERSGNRE